MMFEPDFIDFIELLNLHQVDYMIVGAHALAYHGRPRLMRKTIIPKKQKIIHGYLI